MTRKIFYVLALCVFSLASIYPVSADTVKKITLKDGSVIRGELISFEQGVYTIQTANLGRLQLPEASVVIVANETVALQTVPVAATPQVVNNSPMVNVGSDANLSGQVSMMHSQIAQNPQAMQAIESLTKDPEIVALISDPELMKEMMAALSQNDPNAVAQNPKIQKLLNNPHMQSVIKNIQDSGAVPQQ